MVGGKKKIHSSGALDDDSVEHCVISSYIQLAVASFSNHSFFFNTENGEGKIQREDGDKMQTNIKQPRHGGQKLTCDRIP